MASAQSWPVSRGGYERTAGASARGRLATAQVRWNVDLGGGVSGSGWLTTRDGDGRLLVLLLRGGRVLARSPGGELRWATGPLAVSSLLGMLDVDGDGDEELLAASLERGLYVLSLEDGSVRWRIAPSPESRFGEAWPADFDGDGSAELYVSDRNCRRNGPCTGRLFSLGGGFPAEVVTLDRSGYTYWLGLGHVAADLDGDGRRELVAFDDARVVAHDASSGAERWALDVDRFPFGRGRGTAVDLDGDGREEVVVTVSTAGASGAKRLFVVEFEDAALRIRWEDRFDPDLGGHRPLGRPVADLLSIAGPEVVTSVYVPSAGRWETRLYAGAGRDATPLQVIFDRVALAVVPGAAGEPAGLLVTEARGRFVPEPGGLELWRLEGAELSMTARLEGAWPLLREAAWNEEALPRWLGPPGGGWVAVDTDADGRAEAVRSWDGGIVHRLPVGSSVVDGLQPPEGGPERLLLSTSSGEIEALDASLALLHEDGARPGHAPLREVVHLAPGIFVNVPEDGGLPILLAGDGEGRLAAYRAPGGTAEQPVRLWWSPRAFVEGVLGRPAYGWLPGHHERVAFFERADDGALLLRVVAGTDGRAVARFVVGGAEAVPLVQPLWMAEAERLLVGVVPTTDYAQAYRLVDPLDGTVSSPTPLDRPLVGSFDRPPLRFDVEADGSAEWLVPQGGWLRVLSADGSSVIRSVRAPVAGTPAAADLDGDGVVEVLHGGGRGVAAFDASLAEMWRFEPRVRHRVPAAVSISGGARVLVPRAQQATVALLNGADGSVVAEAALAGGARYDDLAAAEAAGAEPGLLGEVVALGDLDGAGTPAFLVGSSDGYLYALSAADLELLWALDLKAAVGPLAVADFDGDGQAEVLAATADGRVHVVDSAELAPPAAVYDTDGTFVATSPRDDRDQLPADRVAANWEPVDGAAFYEVQLEREADGLVVVPWTEASGGTRHRFEGLVVPVGDRYVVRVRAVASGRSTVSPAATSDGFLALEPVGPPPPADGGVDGGVEADGGAADATADGPGEPTWDAEGGCGCAVGLASRETSGAAWLLLGLLGWLALRRRPA